MGDGLGAGVPRLSRRILAELWGRPRREGRIVSRKGLWELSGPRSASHSGEPRGVAGRTGGRGEVEPRQGNGAPYNLDAPGRPAAIVTVADCADCSGLTRRVSEEDRVVPFPVKRILREQSGIRELDKRDRTMVRSLRATTVRRFAATGGLSTPWSAPCSTFRVTRWPGGSTGRWGGSVANQR